MEAALTATSPLSTTREDFGSLERLGETWEFRSLLLQLLRLQGWTVDQRPAFAGGVLVLASKNGIEVRRQGETVADVATEVFQEATRLQRLALDQPLQLELG